VCVEAIVCNTQQFAVKAIPLDPRFAASDKNDSVSFCVECEGKTPYAAVRIESQFFHIRVARTLQCVDLRPSK